MAGYAPTAPKAVFDALADRKLLVVSGKGGVGRTSVAALVGLELAARGRRTLVATTGHDDRLAWMLGESKLHDEAKEVAPRLWIQRLVPKTCIREYGGIMMRSQRLANMVFGNRVIERMLGAVPGLDDYAVLGKSWHEAARGEDYDTVIFDGPASGHLVLNLGVPRTIVETAPRGILVDEAISVVETLRNPAHAAAVLVGLPELWPLTELDELAQALREDVGLATGAVVVNKAWPRVDAELPSARFETGSDAAAWHGLGRALGRGRAESEALESWSAERPRRGGEELPQFEIPFVAQGLESMPDFRALRATLAGGAA